MPFSRETLAALIDASRASLGFPAAVAMALGLVFGLALPELDEWLDVSVPLFVFSTEDAARSMLETIAMATVTVAGISISVTVVALTLLANQLSPRVLRSFRRDLTSQLTLAAFLGTFIYCVAVLVRLGSLGPDQVPSLSIAVAVALALMAFAAFAHFIGHISTMLQPSSVITSITDDARTELEHPYPAGVGREPEDLATVEREIEALTRSSSSRAIHSTREGFLVVVRGAGIVKFAETHDLLVRQIAPVGSYVLPEQVLAEAWTLSGGRIEGIEERLVSCFLLGQQRSLPQDPGFPVRQLADVALKGLSPSINDTTTAVNAMEAMSADLIRFARSKRSAAVRLGESGRPRLIALVEELDRLVELGFEQVIRLARSDPPVEERLRELLSAVRQTAIDEGLTHARIDRMLCGGATSDESP